MRASFGELFAMRDDIVLLAGRLLLAWIFLHEGAFLLSNYSASSAGMAKMGVKYDEIIKHYYTGVELTKAY